MTVAGILLLVALCGLAMATTTSSWTSADPCPCCGGATSPDCLCTNMAVDLHVVFDGWDCLCLAGPTTRAVAISATPGPSITDWDSKRAADYGDGCDNNSLPRCDDCVTTTGDNSTPFRVLLFCDADDFGNKFYQLTILWCACFFNSGAGLPPNYCNAIARSILAGPIADPSSCSPLHLVFTDFFWDVPFPFCTSGGAFLETTMCTGGTLPTSATVTL